jgi:uncharacterized protein (TIGR02058 family)
VPALAQQQLVQCRQPLVAEVLEDAKEIITSKMCSLLNAVSGTTLTVKMRQKLQVRAPHRVVSSNKYVPINMCQRKIDALAKQCFRCFVFSAVRACRNSIEFNSIPSVNRLVPGGYDALKLDVLLAVPPKYRDSLDLEKVQEVFPYGSVRFQIQDGGMIAPSGIAIDELGDTNDDMVVVCAAVTVGY